MNQEPQTVKIVVVGDGTVGKTCILLTYTQDKFPVDYVPTVFENYTAQVELDKHQIQVSLWDTAGQESYSRLRQLSYSSADAFIIVYSVTEPGTFENVFGKWIPELSTQELEGIPKLIVGNKIDKQPPSPEEIQVLQQSKCKYLHCSALTSHNIKQVFETAIRMVLQQQDQKKSIPPKPKKKKSWCCML